MPTPKLSEELAREAVLVLDACKGDESAAAEKLGIPRGTFQGRVRTAKSRFGIIPKPRPRVTGTSTLYDADGKLMLQWVKESNGAKSPEEWAAHVKDVFADAVPVSRIQRGSGHRKDLLTVYPIGDHHVAMYSWAEETGASYDIKISENLLSSAMSHLVAKAEPTQRALIVNVGDFFHVDNLKNETSRSGNTLDVDTRYAAMIRAGLKMLRAAVECALSKHDHVTLICAIGNHDDVGSLWLSQSLALFYSNNPRVHVETSPAKFHYYRFGKVLIGVTHGDTGKPEKLQSVMAADRPSDWGETRFRYWLTGHIHSRKVLEFPGVMWETFRTLAPADAWASAAGYRAGRDMTSITLHQEYGEIARDVFNVAMVAA